MHERGALAGGLWSFPGSPVLAPSPGRPAPLQPGKTLPALAGGILFRRLRVGGGARRELGRAGRGVLVELARQSGTGGGARARPGRVCSRQSRSVGGVWSLGHSLNGGACWSGCWAWDGACLGGARAVPYGRGGRAQGPDSHPCPGGQVLFVQEEQPGQRTGSFRSLSEG